MTVSFSQQQLEEIKKEEEKVICRALRDSNNPKITKDDMPIFTGLINDLFPGVVVDRLKHEVLENTIIECTKLRGLQPEPSFMLKIVQLEELLPIRHSIFILGHAAVGKTAVWSILADTRRKMKPKEKLLYQIINPKAVTTRELYGYIQPSTREWKDGVLSTVMRDYAAVQNTHDKWVVLDGDVDTIWIESLNTVMDDNKILTLASNERIPLLPHMRMMFEIGSLQYASPATVSRAGIIYVNESDVGWGPYYQSWVDKFEKSPLYNSDKFKSGDSKIDFKASSIITSQLTVLAQKYINSCVEWVKRSQYKTIVPVNDMAVVQSITRILQSLLDNYVATQAYRNNCQAALNNLQSQANNQQNTQQDYSKEVIEFFMIFSCIWGVGGMLCRDNGIDHKINFSKNWKLEYSKGIQFPVGDEQSTIFDYYVDVEETGQPTWKAWVDRVVPYDHNADSSVKDIHVETVDSYRLHYLMQNLIQAGYPTMLAGPAGLGKSVLFRSKLNHFIAKGNWQTVSIAMNYYTTSAQLQMIMETYLFKNGKKFGPKNNKRLIYQIDDLNMSQVDIYGTQQPITFLRQQQDWKFWWDREKLQPKEIENIQFVATMNPYAGSFEINQQYQWHFTTFSIELPSSKILNQIYGNIFNAHLQTDAKFASVKKLGSSIIQTLLDIHNKVTAEFPPTAIKFHYQFNLRDLTNIVDNLMQVKPDHCKTYETLTSLLVHECDRVYMDRLVDFTDRERYVKAITDIITKNLSTVTTISESKSAKANAVPQQIQINVDMAEVFNKEKINIFTNFALGIGEGSYAQISQSQKLKQLLDEALLNHNQEKAEMNLVLFQDAMEHICRISRIISTSDALLVGVGGSGKQSLAKLAAYINGYDVFQIVISANYGIEAFKEDIQLLYENTGLKGNQTMFLFTDQQIVSEEFLVCINDILSSGQIAGLFPPDKEEEIIGQMRNKVKEAQMPDTDENCKEMFIRLVKQNLHVVLGFSPSEQFRTRCRKFPGLVTCTTIDWFQPWPHDALRSVARNFLLNREKEKPKQYQDIEIDFDDKTVDAIALFMADAHTLVEKDIRVQYEKNERRKAYTTPKSFLELINMYLRLLYDNTSAINSRINKLETGNATLVKTEEQVQVLKKQLEIKKGQTNQKKSEVEQMLVGLNEKTRLTNEEKQKATIKQKEAASIEANVKQAKAQADAELSLAQPALERATEALNSLDKPSLDELSKYGNPHINIITLMSAVQFILHEPGQIKSDVSWKSAQNIMKNGAQFLNTLKTFDGRTINPVNKQAVQNLFDTKSDVFDTVEMKRKSKAAGGLCDWIRNIVEFNTVFQKVDPLVKNSVVLKQQAEEAQSESDRAKATVDKLDAELKILQAEFDSANRDKDKLVREQEEMEYSLEMANKLVNGLSSEKVRWKQQVIKLKEQDQTIKGDVLITSAFISYAGPFSKRYRVELVQKWIEKAHSLQIPLVQEKDVDGKPKQFKPLAMLADAAKIAGWNNNGLPTDEVSLENAAIFTAATRWPLIIDPQLQGMNWIKKTEGASLKIIRFNQNNWMDIVKKALSDGSPVLVENMGETIDATLNPILARAIIQKPGGKKAITLGENEVEYNDNFRIYFQTKLPNPHYTPETQAQTTLINFTVTEEGLEDQLLADVVGKERADLEAKKQDLIQQQNDFKIKLQQLEKDLLDRLSNVGDNIIQDTKLIASLEETKRISTEIEQKVKIAEITEKEIDEARSSYKPIAARAAMLYFLLNSLSVIDHFYQYSLAAFKIVFFRAIAGAEKCDDLQQRITTLRDEITNATYQYANRGLFERHRLIFNSQLCFNILRKEGNLPADEFSFLINGTLEPGQDNPLSDCVSSQSWNCVTALNRVKGFENIISDINGSAKRWKEWIQDEQPENQQLPQDWKNKTPLQQLCIIRALRPDRLLTAMRKFISVSISDKYIEAVPFNFVEVYNVMSRAEPLFFILSPGVDPVKDVESLGLKKGFTFENGKLKSVSLGQGQEKNAENGIVNMAKQGGWVLLQNIHLMRNWQYKLEKMMDEYCNDASHQDFRLFVSAEPNSDPEQAAVLPGIVQMCLKATNEPPTGMKANMNRALAQLSPDTFEMCQNKTNEFKSMLYGLVFFHSCLLERRKFGSIGWNVSYNFTNGDLLICKDVLFNYLEANPKIPYEDLRYMFTDIFYGGHIGDDLDRRYIKTFAFEIFNEGLFEDGKLLAPEFPAPGPLTYQEYKEYTSSSLPEDSPKMFGLHPNAEITYLTTQSSNLFNNLILLQPTGALGGSGELGRSKEEIVAGRVETLLTQIPTEDYPIGDLNDRNSEAQPFMSVCIQECTRINSLVQTMRTSLLELQLGLKGDLSMSDAMEKLLQSIYMDSVPKTWEAFAYPSLKKLPLWILDLEIRIKQLNDWSADLNLPKCVWLSGLFNPQSFLRAVLQTTARAQKLPLDFMALQVEILKKDLADMTTPQRDGAAIHGLYFDGARWDRKSTSIRDSILKDLYPLLPPISLKAVPIDKAELKDTYECPVYMNRNRNRITYVWSFNIKTREPASKWILAGVAILLAND